MLKTIRDFYNWNKLFFVVRKETEPTPVIADYSNEFLSSLCSATGYFVYGPTADKFNRLIIEAIERYHAWHNRERPNMKPLCLDIAYPFAKRSE